MSALDDLEAGLPPEQLVPGDADSVEQAAAECRRIADKLAETRRNVDYIELRDGDWTGGAADVYFAVKDADLGVLDVSSKALEDAATALGDYAVMLRDARRRAAEALEEYRNGKAVAEQQAWVAATTPAPLDPTVVQPTPVPEAPVTSYQDGPVAKLTAARDDVTIAGGNAATSLQRTRESAPTTAPPGTVTTTTVTTTPTVWDTLESGIDTFETTVDQTATEATDVTADPLAEGEALAADVEGEAGGGLPFGSAGAATMLSVLAMFGGAGAVAALRNHVRGPAALATNLPPGVADRLGLLGERANGMPMTNTPVGQGGLGSAMRGAGGGSLGHSGGRGSGGLDIDGSGVRGGRRARMLRGISTWLDDGDLVDDDELPEAQ